MSDKWCPIDSIRNNQAYPALDLTPGNQELIDDIHNLPSLYRHDHYVYFLLGEWGEILYVGQSATPQLRVKAHSKRWRFYDVKLHRLASRKEALALEAELIQMFRPLYNDQMKYE